MAQLVELNNFLEVDYIDWWELRERLYKEEIYTIDQAVEICRHEIIRLYSGDSDLQVKAAIFEHYLYLCAMRELLEPGYYTIVSYYNADKSWMRKDQYHCNDTVYDKNFNSVFVVGVNDTSKHNHKYDPDCSCCFLGFGHSEDYHKQSISKADFNK